MRLVARTAFALAVAAGLAACGTERTVEQQSGLGGACVRCHVLEFGPPLELEGQLVTVHEFHVERGVACATCHTGYDPATGPATHGNGTVDASVEEGTWTKAASFTDPTPTWPATCGACHTALPPL